MRPARLERIAIVPEAIENNAVYYELATDLIWDDSQPVAEWLEAFAEQRYGCDEPQFREAWRLLGTTLYGYAKQVVSEVVAVGRAGTLIDWQPAEDRAYAAFYQAESIVNWRVTRVRGRSTPTEPAPSVPLPPTPARTRARTPSP